jgi:hypothetical protein
MQSGNWRAAGVREAPAGARALGSLFALYSMG